MPYNPGVQDMSGQLLAQGIGDASDALTKGLEQWKKKSDQAKALRTALSVYMPDQKDKFQAMGLPELEGQVQGLSMQATARAQQAQQVQEASRSDLLKSQVAQDAMRTSAMQQSQAAMQQYQLLNGAQLQGNEQGPPRPPVTDAATALRNAIAAGIAPKEIGEMASGISHLDNLSAGDESTFIEDPESGERFLKYRKTVLPSGVNPIKSFGQAQGLVDEQGNPIGAWAVRNPRGQIQIVKPPNEGTDALAKADATAKLEGVLQGLDKQIQGSEARNAGIAAKTKGYEGLSPVPPQQLDELRQRRTQVKGHLDTLNGASAARGGGVGFVGGTGGNGPRGGPGQTGPGPGPSSTGAAGPVNAAGAAQVKAAFKAGKISKAEAIQQLKAMGFE